MHIPSLVCSFILSAPVPAQTQTASPTLTAEQVVGKVQAFYEKTPHLRAAFRQTIVNATFGDRPPSWGRLYLKKPDEEAVKAGRIGKMRFDYFAPGSRNRGRKVSKTFVSDGETLWAVFHEDKNVYVKDVKGDLLPVAVTFLAGTGDLLRDFTPSLDKDSKLGKKGDHVVKLTPKTPSAQYKYLWLVVAKDNFRVRQSVVLNAKGDKNKFEFFEPDMKKPVLDTMFTFDIKANPTYKISKPKPAKK